MESSSIKLKITLIVIATDKTKPVTDLSSYKFLLDENNKPISCTVTSLSEGHDVILKRIFEKYINYDYDYVYKLLVAARSQDDLIEICYIANMPYIKGFNKFGNLYDLQDFSNEIIKLEDFYEELYSKNGARSFR